jgi:hypothetical protein
LGAVFRNAAPQALQNLSPGSLGLPQRGQYTAPSYPITRSNAVVYICRVIGFARRLRGRAIGLGALVLSAILLGALSGCGSDDEGVSKGEAGSPAKTATSGTVPGEPRTGPVAEGKRPAQGTAAREKAEGGVGPGAGPGDGDDARRLAKICPRGLTRAECRSVVKQLAKASPSHRMNEPRDCLEVMSRDECEALARALADARTGSVNVEECVRNPTPHCEEVLGPVLEAQYAASQEAGE